MLEALIPLAIILSLINLSGKGKMWGAALPVRLQAASLSLVLGAVVFMACPGQTMASEDNAGYFLSLEQKGQLLWDGSIQGEQDNWYDVWVVPGYVAPSRIAREGFKDAGDDFGEYFAGKKYLDLADDSGDAYRFAFKDSLVDFTLKGTPRAWKKNFTKAHRRTERRVFGWWFAYPWAFFTSVTDNLFRIPAGVAGTALGTTWGTAVVPTWYLTNSAVKGVGNATVGGLLVPAAGYSWNSVIAPPLALVGQKPHPSRADGFWVRRLNSAERERALAATEPLQAADFALLENWGRLLLDETGPYQEQMRAINDQAAAEIRASNNKRTEALRAARCAEQQQVQSLLTLPEQQSLLLQLQAKTLGRMQQGWRKGLRERLAAEGMADTEIERLVMLISTYRDKLGTTPVKVSEKTDPLKQIFTTPERF